MTDPAPSPLVPLIQLSISPMILISGVGMLLLTLSNRFARVVDRTRSISRDLRQTPENARTGLQQQLAVLYRRSRLLRFSITLAGCSVLAAGSLILVLFVGAILGRGLFAPAATLFLCGVALLVASVVVFLFDLHLSLRALDQELERPAGGAR